MDTIDYVPAKSPRRVGVRFRVIMTFGLLSLFCALMVPDTFGLLHAINPGNDARPNIGWIALTVITGAPALVTAFFSFLATGRPW